MEYADSLQIFVLAASSVLKEDEEEGGSTQSLEEQHEQVAQAEAKFLNERLQVLVETPESRADLDDWRSKISTGRPVCQLIRIQLSDYKETSELVAKKEEALNGDGGEEEKRRSRAELAQLKAKLDYLEGAIESPLNDLNRLADDIRDRAR